MAIDLSIIIVNYKTPALAIDCLRTIFSQPNHISFEVIIVDNASGDNNKELITTAFPQVRWIQMQYNAGFARANNEAIRQSTGNVVLLLNSDTLVEDNAIENCYRQFIASGYVACGVQLLNADRTLQISGSFFMIGGLNHLLPLPFIGPMVKWLGNMTKTKNPNVTEATTVTEVDWINGAYLMVKKSAIEKAGMMDEDFFLYAEEAEWCSRLGKLGKLCIYGQFHVIHLLGETANKTFGSIGKAYSNLYDKKGLQIMLSNLLRVRKQLGIGWYLLLMLIFTFEIPVYFILSFLFDICRFRNPFPNLILAARFTRNVGKLWSYSFRIIGGRPYFYKVL